MVLVSQEFKKICLPNPQIVADFVFLSQTSYYTCVNVDGSISFFPVIFSIAVFTYLDAHIQDFLWRFNKILSLITLSLLTLISNLDRRQMI